MFEAALTAGAGLREGRINSRMKAKAKANKGGRFVLQRRNRRATGISAADASRYRVDDIVDPDEAENA